MKKHTALLMMAALYSCASLKNPAKPEYTGDGGRFEKAGDGCNIFVYDYVPQEQYRSVIFLISGITGINHHREKDIIELLGNNENRVVVIHPRGTGYSDGCRGDISDFSLFIDDYAGIISRDRDFAGKQHRVILYGHSMSTAVLLAVAEKLKNIDGAILVNPPYMQKAAKGMSPGFFQYVKYACYMIFAKHKPIVNMAGDPSLIENEDDRNESLQRIGDPLLVKYFSMYYMNETRKLMQQMPGYCREAGYPLLLVYGLKDNIVDKKGCDLVFEKWKCPDKKYVLIENGSHGKSTVKLAADTITGWINPN